MLPFGGQGSNQAIEDGGALGYLLQGVERAAEISSRLDLFEKVRRDRASRVQTLSKVRIGREKEVEQELKQYVDTVNSGKPPFVSRVTMVKLVDVQLQQYQAHSQSEYRMILGKS